MKYWIICCFVFYFVLKSKSQNLVPNPNFKTATINSNAQLSKMYASTVHPTFNPNGSAYTNLTAGTNLLL